jgi:hypothetical protein
MLVNFAIGGTASNSADYALIQPWVVVSNAFSNAFVVVAPIQDTVAETTETVTVTILAGTGYGIGSPSSAVIQIVPMMIDTWKIQYFGTNANSSNAADSADWDGDLVKNLMEYVLYRNPTNPEPDPEFTARITSLSSNEYFNLYYTRRMQMPDAKVWAEFTTNLLTGAWLTGTAHIVESVTDLSPTQLVTATVTNPPVKTAPFGAGRLKAGRIAP